MPDAGPGGAGEGVGVVLGEVGIASGDIGAPGGALVTGSAPVPLGVLL